MQLSLPFLYLPDAISLSLMLIILDLLRRSAVVHLRQELLGIRKGLFFYWSGKKLPVSDPAYLDLLSRIDSGVRLAHKLSPARLFFVRRSLSRMEKQSGGQSVKDQPREPGTRLDHFEAEKVRKKLQRIELETNLLLGVFLLVASVSGWILLLGIVSRVFLRLFSRKSGSRIDYVFDLAEKLVARFGARSLRIALASESG